MARPITIRAAWISAAGVIGAALITVGFAIVKDCHHGEAAGPETTLTLSGTDERDTNLAANPVGSETSSSVLELVDLMEARALLVRGQLAIQESLLANDLLAHSPPDAQAKLRATRATFENLHQRHLVAIRTGQHVLAHEISNEINNLLRSVLPVGTKPAFDYDKQ